MLAPYLLDSKSVDHMRDDLERVLIIERKLAEEFADAFVPLDTLFAEAVKTQPEPLFYSNDGVHPNQNGAEFIAKHLVDALSKLL